MTTKRQARKPSSDSAFILRDFERLRYDLELVYRDLGLLRRGALEIRTTIENMTATVDSLAERVKSGEGMGKK